MTTITILYSLIHDANTYIATSDHPDDGETLTFSDIGQALFHVQQEYREQDMELSDFTVTLEEENALFIATATILDADPTVQTDDLHLVYEDEQGKRHYQHYRDAVDMAGLIDPDTGEEFRVLGWTTELAGDE